MFIQLNRGVLIEPYYKPASFDENNSYDRHQAIITGYVEKSSTNQDADSYSSIVSNAGDLARLNPRRSK